MKVFVIPKRWVSAALCGVLAAVMFLLVSHPNAVGAAATQKQLPIYCVESAEKRVAISFDAAWGNEDTQLLIDILGQYQVPATFFLVGQWVENYPDSVRALAEAGHSVQNHSDTHPHLTELDVNGIAAEINTCNDRIEALTGRRPTLIRPPFGDYDNHVVDTIRSLGMEPIQWDVDASHAEGKTAAGSLGQSLLHPV